MGPITRTPVVIRPMILPKVRVSSLPFRGKYIDTTPSQKAKKASPAKLSLPDRVIVINRIGDHANREAIAAIRADLAKRSGHVRRRPVMSAKRK